MVPVKDRPWQRILVTGAHGCGKTTLATALSEFLGAPLLKETAREVLEENELRGDKLHELPAVEIMRLQEEIYRRVYWGKWQGGKQLVLDRGEPDSYVYGLFHLHGSPEAQGFLAWLKAEALAARTSYDAVFLCPPNIPLVDDGMRGAAEHTREVVHLLMKGALAGLGYHLVYELSENTPEGRMEEALYALNIFWS